MFHSLTSTVSFWLALFKTSLKSALALRAAFYLQALFMALNNLAFFVFWWALFAKVPSIRGWQLGDMALLFGVSAAGFGLAVIGAGGAFQLGEKINEGELDPLLVQPKPTLLYALGSRAGASGFGDLASGVALIALSGKAPWSHAPLVILAIVSSAVVTAASNALHQSLTFWLGRSEALARMLFDCTLTFSLYPEPLFGGGLKLLLYTLIPAGLVGFLPVRVLREPTLGGAITLFAAAVAYAAFASFIFRRGLRRYASGSRFGVFG